MEYDLNDLKEAADDAGLKFYGPYNGRGFHKGYAVQLDSDADLLELGAQMGKREMGELFGYAHIDSLGRGLIVSFPRDMFTADEADEEEDAE
jgi:hypothetical protein